MQKTLNFIWHAQVRNYEIDLQGIVNNAVYLQYFDHVRVQHMKSKNLDWAAYHAQGLDLVMTHVDMKIQDSLRINDEFYITSTYQKVGRLRIVFTQQLYRKENDKCVASADSTIVCIDRKSNKPVMPKELDAVFFGS